MLVFLLVAPGTSADASTKGKVPGKAKAKAWLGRTVGVEPVVRAQHWLQETPAGTAHVVEKWGRKNQLLERTLNFNGRTEVSIDRDGDGRLEEWEYFSANVHVKLSEPRFGNFMLMDVEQERERDIVKLKLRRQPSGEYRVFAQYREPLRPQFLQGTSGLDVDIVAGQCKESETSIQTNAININQALTGLSKETVKGTITGHMMNESCKKEPFKDSKQLSAMAEGIYTIFRSDKDFIAPIDYEDKTRPEYKARRASQKVDRVKNGNYDGIPDHPAYLGCLRRYQLDTHASRIESGLWEYQRKDGLGEHYYNWKIACEVDTSPPEVVKCGTDVPKAKDGKCYNPVRGRARKVGGFPQISFVKQGCEIDPMLCDSTPGQFAKSFFHEMLHYSGIPDGPLADAITDCCSQGKVGHPKCKELRKETEILKDAQRGWNHVLGQAPGDLAKLTKICQDVHGGDCTAKANEFVNLNARKRAQIKDEYPECRDRDDEGPEEAKCQDLFREARRISVNAVFNDVECSVSRTLESLSPKERDGKCKALRQAMNNLLDTGETIPNNDFCVKSRRQLGLHCPKPLLFFTPARAVAQSESSDFCESIAGLKQKVNFSDKLYYDTEYRMSEGVPDPYKASRNTIDDVADLTGLQGPKPNLGNSTKIDHGPARPTYPAQPGKRAEAIAFDLRRQSDFSNRVEQYTGMAFRELLPAANARAQAMTDSSFSLPDPLNREVSNIAGPAERRSQSTAINQRREARAPAAVVGRESGKSADLKMERGRVKGEGPTGAAGSKAVGARTGAGVPGGGSGVPGGTAGKKVEDPTAREALINFLLGIQEVAVLRVELGRSSTLTLLETHMVAVIDDKGKRHPADSEAKHWLIFSHEKGRLVRMEER